MLPPTSLPHEMMSLSDWARMKGIRYMTAWKWFRQGKLPVRAQQMPSGMILVERVGALAPSEIETWVYARVNAPGETFGLREQVRQCELFAAAQGWAISGTREEVGASTAPDRAKLQQVLQHLGKREHSRLLVTDPSRLTRLDYPSWSILLSALGCELVVLDQTVSLSGALDDCVHGMRHLLGRRWGVKRRALLLDEISSVIGRAS